jgi:hypothetical protein
MNRPLTLDDKKENNEGDDNHDNKAHNLDSFHTIIYISCAKIKNSAIRVFPFPVNTEKGKKKYIQRKGIRLKKRGRTPS